MRGREFLMKDAYSFDLDRAGAIRAYNKMFVCYLRTLRAHGPEGDPDARRDRADRRRSQPRIRHPRRYRRERDRLPPRLSSGWLVGPTIDFDGDLQPIVDAYHRAYAATDEQRDPETEAALGRRTGDRPRDRGRPHLLFRHQVFEADGRHRDRTATAKTVRVEMGSYGIGVSRLVAAIIEASHDDAGIIWPASGGAVRRRPDQSQAGRRRDCAAICERLYAALDGSGIEVLYDDRNERPGVKFAEMDLIGLPLQIIVGPRGAEGGKVEVKDRRSGERARADRRSGARACSLG